MGCATRCLRGLFVGSKSASSISGESKPPKENNLRRFGKSFPEGTVTPASTPPAVTPQWAHPVAGKEGGEQSKRAIAVAAATTAVAEAAVVVRMTSSGMSTDAAGKQELAMAAVRIQAAFRGYLARHALKALRGLVKLQALVRGNMVRRQATETLRCMHALVRAQARARARRALRSQRCSAPPRSTSKTTYGGMVSRARSQSCRRNWLDGWTERCMDDAKSLEVHTGKPGQYSSSSGRRGDGGNNMQSSCSTLTSDRNSGSFTILPDSPSKDSTAAVQMSPQLFSAASRPWSSKRGALTPTMSECSRGAVPGGYSDYPNYMARTESFRAKARSQSAPKQRPQYDKSGSIRKPSPGAQRVASLRAEFASTLYPGSGMLDRIGLATKC